MHIKDECKRAHAIARSKGFYELTDLLVHIAGNHSEKLENFAYDAEVSKRIALIQGELGEALEALRKSNRGHEVKDTFEDELADVAIRLFDLCEFAGVDLEKQIEWKSNYNSGREHKHGKRF